MSTVQRLARRRSAVLTLLASELRLAARFSVALARGGCDHGAIDLASGADKNGEPPLDEQ